VDAEKPIVFKQRSATFAIFMGLSGKSDLLTLKKYADQIEYDLYNSGVMSQITVSGYPDLEISVEVSEQNLLRYNLTLMRLPGPLLPITWIFLGDRSARKMRRSSSAPATDRSSRKQ